MFGYRDHNQPGMGVERSYSREYESLFNSYEHLQGLPRGDTALTMLRKVASMVKPIMRKRGWKVQILAEFLPPEYNLLGLNINKGFKICIRLRYHHNPGLFLPVEEICDTMLHELSHNVFGAHDANFHALWEELRDEYETLMLKGFTGEGFLSDGHVLGGGYRAVPPPQEMRRQARASAELRQRQNKLTKGSGQRLGGTPLHMKGGDVRQVITGQISRRNNINKGCASGRNDANQLSQQSGANTFKTKAEEDDANNRAIAQALYELMEQEEERKLNGTFSTSPNDGGLAWHPEHGLYDPTQGKKAPTSRGYQNDSLSEEEQLKWAMQESMGHKRGLSDDEVQIVSPLSPDRAPYRNMHRPGRPANANKSELPPLASSPKAIRNSSRSIHDVSPLSQSTSHEQTSSQTSMTPTSAVFGNIAMDISEPFDPDQWTCEVCTCVNPIRFLACDACASERPQAATVSSRAWADPIANERNSIAPSIQHARTTGWHCPRCTAFMEHKWWTCSSCGTMKHSS
nr:dna-dependent metalloprotease wss1 [Quercus suber]